MILYSSKFVKVNKNKQISQCVGKIQKHTYLLCNLQITSAQKNIVYCKHLSHRIKFLCKLDGMLSEYQMILFEKSLCYFIGIFTAFQ